MFEVLDRSEPVYDDEADQPEVDIDALYLAADPQTRRRYFEDDPDGPPYNPAFLAEIEALGPPPPERVYYEQDRPLHQRDPDTFTDAEAVTRLVEVEADIAAAHALRARLVTLLAANRPAAGDRPAGQPAAAAAATPTVGEEVAGTDVAGTGEVVPEVLDVSEWLAHELQMAHPYSWPAAQALVETSLVLSGRLTASLGLLRAGRIDYRRAQILTDLLGTCSTEAAHTVEAMVLPKAPAMTPGGLASAVRRALARVDAAALRRRHTRARRTADVRYWPTQDGMARLVADLPLPTAVACSDAVAGYARAQQADGDTRPISQIRTEMLTDLILRPRDTTRPAVTAEVTIHLTIPTTPNPRGNGAAGETVPARLDEAAAQAEVDGHHISPAQCRELLTQLHTSRLFLALHHPTGGLTAVATPAQLRRAAHHTRSRTSGSAGPGLTPPPATGGYRPTRAQDRHIRTRDRNCRHFGCNRSATHADLDHHTPWPTGQTTTTNLTSYCRTHHRLKHQAPGWTRHLHPDGTLTITTPTGTTRTTRPPAPADQTEPEPDWPAPPAPPPRPEQAATPAPSDNDPPPF